MGTERTAVGKLSLVRGKYVLTVGKKKSELPVGTLIPNDQIKKLVGKPVEVAFASKPSAAIIGVRPSLQQTTIKNRWILCYVPRPDFMSAIQPDLRAAAVKSLIANKIISPSLGEEFLG
jgi:hypothetical protein